MPTTQIWTQFGEAISAAPRETLAAFLGHGPSVALVRERGIALPSAEDFRADPAYNPNRHKLDLDAEYVEGNFLLLCVATWGAAPLVRAANACSLLQCMHHTPPDARYRQMRNDAACAVLALCDQPTDEVRARADELRRQCNAEYRAHEDDPDSEAARSVWYELGAPWFALEYCLGKDVTRARDASSADSSWILRATVWPHRALDAAAHWSSLTLVNQVLRSTLIAWATADTQRAR